ncbi:MAG TPA: hypothetical protein VF796_10860 [Humisphaera sp.]
MLKFILLAGLLAVGVVGCHPFHDHHHHDRYGYGPRYDRCDDGYYGHRHRW